MNKFDAFFLNEGILHHREKNVFFKVFYFIAILSPYLLMLDLALYFYILRKYLFNPATNPLVPLEFYTNICISTEALFVGVYASTPCVFVFVAVKVYRRSMMAKKKRQKGALSAIVVVSDAFSVLSSVKPVQAEETSKKLKIEESMEKYEFEFNNNNNEKANVNDFVKTKTEMFEII